MSLLLEALKKAERAKEEAQRRAEGGSRHEGGSRAENEPRRELRLQEEHAAAREKPRVLTRAELPDISQPLEILTDDLAPQAARGAAPEQGKAPAGAPFAAPGARPGAEPAAQRAAARKVFEAKFKEPNPRLPFYLSMGALGVATVCTIGYFWYQLRPPPALVNANPPVSAAPVAAAPSAPAVASAPAATLAPAPIPGLPSAMVIPATPSAPVRSPLVEQPVRNLSPAARAAPAAASPAPQARSAPIIDPGPQPGAARPAPQVNPKVESGYAAYLAGNLAAARTDYEQALRDDPANRDALLGLAALDVRGGRLEAAEATYLRLLQADPRDAHAQAGLIALRGGRMDPLVAESRLKNLLATDPGAHVLHFALGNQLAQQERWPEAQQQYFKAYAADPENADFAYNLAVSLDHLRQPKPALEYYQRALALAARRGASFDAAAARARITQLGN